MRRFRARLTRFGVFDPKASRGSAARRKKRLLLCIDVPSCEGFEQVKRDVFSYGRWR